MTPRGEERPTEGIGELDNRYGPCTCPCHEPNDDGYCENCCGGPKVMRDAVIALEARHAGLVAAARELMDLLLRGPKCVDCGKGGYLRPDGKFVHDPHQTGCRVVALRAALAREEEGKG